MEVTFEARGRLCGVDTTDMGTYVATVQQDGSLLGEGQGLIRGASNEVAYGMTKALWTNLGLLTAAHAAAKAIDPKRALEGMPVPLHPGAAKYYKEVGILK